jgi:hypothetical protein
MIRRADLVDGQWVWCCQPTLDASDYGYGGGFILELPWRGQVRLKEHYGAKIIIAHEGAEPDDSRREAACDEEQLFATDTEALAYYIGECQREAAEWMRRAADAGRAFAEEQRWRNNEQVLANSQA